MDVQQVCLQYGQHGHAIDNVNNMSVYMCKAKQQVFKVRNSVSNTSTSKGSVGGRGRSRLGIMSSFPFLTAASKARTVSIVGIVITLRPLSQWPKVNPTR